MITVTVGKRGQITLPSAVRRRTGIQDGDRMAISLEGDRIVLLPLGKTLLDLRGSIAVTAPQDFAQIRRQVLQQRARRADAHEG
ncbi:MAG: AbrB/MazE/SpoVT family DNA-binding domain-containing protein [Anaerolineae bacterium]|nr:AbrB/MazE/SpoVT family DNA-binding domain-containing protein [Anaerolineae bacterium]